MELVKVRAGLGDLRVTVEDCAALARICYEAEDGLMMAEDAHLQAAAKAFGAFFRALAVATVAPGNQSGLERTAGELEAVGLGELVDLGAGKGEQ